MDAVRTPPVVRARFVERPNRFLVVAELETGQRVRAYLPNTGRLGHLATPGTPFILRKDGAPPRTTAYTAIRAWNGCWVALEASTAPQLLTAWLRSGEPLGAYGPVRDIRREVAAGGHRLDLLATAAGGQVWVEVKSGGRAVDGVALLSGTPSTRGVAHLTTLARLVADGHRAAAAFVVQRSDARALSIGGEADPGWIVAVRRAHEGGVAILAYGCDVDEDDVHIARTLPITWDG